MSAKTVLVVEDDADLREMLSLVLTSQGFQVEVLVDGAQALGRLACWPPPSLVLIDLRMPSIDGASVLRQLRSSPLLAPLPVVVMSGERSGEERALRAGATAFLAKPFGIPELVAAVDQALRQADDAHPTV